MGAFILLSFRGNVPGNINSYIFGAVVLSTAMYVAFRIFWYHQDIIRNIIVFIVNMLKRILSSSTYTDGYINTNSEKIKEKIDNMYNTMYIIFEDPKEVLTVFIIAHISSLAIIGIFMLSGISLSIGFSFSMAIMIVVLGKIGSIIPSPGGVGGVEPLMIMLTVLLTNASAPQATVVVLLYRIFSYWGVVFTGSVVSSFTEYSL